MPDSSGQLRAALQLRSGGLLAIEGSTIPRPAVREQRGERDTRKDVAGIWLARGKRFAPRLLGPPVSRADRRGNSLPGR